MVFGLFKAKQMECAPYQHEHDHPEPPPLIKFLLDLGIPEFVETGVAVINLCVALLLLVTCAIAVMNVGIFTVNRILGTEYHGVFMLAGKGKKPMLIAIKMNVGSTIMLALNILIAADVIDTLLKPSHEYKMEDLYKLCLIAGVRTFLSYFLGKELEEAKELLEHQMQHPEHPLVF